MTYTLVMSRFAFHAQNRAELEVKLSWHRCDDGIGVVSDSMMQKPLFVS